MPYFQSGQIAHARDSKSKDVSTNPPHIKKLISTDKGRKIRRIVSMGWDNLGKVKAIVSFLHYWILAVTKIISGATTKVLTQGNSFF